VDKDERVQRRFIRYTLRSLGWTDIYDLPPYEHRALACIMFIFDILIVRVNSPNLLSALDFSFFELSATFKLYVSLFHMKKFELTVGPYV
jgi:hypothetical protein